MWEDCDRVADCRFMKPAPDIKIPPILFIAHARYPNLVENPIKFQTWIDPDGNIRLRKLVVCDEGPEMTDIAPLDSTSMYDTSRMVSDINNFRFPDYVSFLWRKNVLNKFFKLLGVINENRNSKDAFGNITPAMMEEAGFCAEQFISVRDKLLANCKSPAAFQKADKVLNALSSERPKKYYTNNGKTTVFCPKLRELHGEGKPATFILDGTTHFNPELKDNQNIDVQDYAFTVNTSRLTVHVQRSNRVKFSKKASDSQKNYAAVLAWVKSILDEARGVHKQVMVITYQKYAARMFKDLADQYGDILIPFTTKDGKVFKKLPYFGGITGSNAYNQCTLIIMAGLNRYNPTEYLNRAIAISGASEKWASMAKVTNEDKAQTLMDAMQAELLSNEVVQDFYRTDLRNHSSSRKVVAYIFQPPGATLSALKQQFPDASVHTISEIPEDAILASLDNKTYGPKQTHGAAIEQYLRKRLSEDPEFSVTPKEIQEATGLSEEEYNTAKKSPMLKAYLAEHFTMTGRGRYRKYAPHGSTSKDAAS